MMANILDSTTECLLAELPIKSNDFSTACSLIELSSLNKNLNMNKATNEGSASREIKTWINFMYS